MFRDFEEFLVYGDHASHASENEHAAVRVKNRRGRHTASGVPFAERQLVSRHVHVHAVAGNYRGGSPDLETNTYGAARA